MEKLTPALYIDYPRRGGMTLSCATALIGVAGIGGNYKRALLQTTKLSAAWRCVWSISTSAAFDVTQPESSNAGAAKSQRIVTIGDFFCNGEIRAH
jgi:hypothetical protein